MMMVTKVEVRLGFFEFVDFLDYFSFYESDFVIKLGLLWIGVYFPFECFLTHLYYE